MSSRHRQTRANRLPHTGCRGLIAEVHSTIGSAQSPSINMTASQLPILLHFMHLNLSYQTAALVVLSCRNRSIRLCCVTVIEIVRFLSFETVESSHHTRMYVKSAQIVTVLVVLMACFCSCSAGTVADSWITVAREARTIFKSCPMDVNMVEAFLWFFVRSIFD